ncbi:MAG TPA: nuclear transport factor 2 family protein [Chryseolinea sp.]|nr:nuclear transport factor 2 family protein [Chryseolinea sp.]
MTEQELLKHALAWDESIVSNDVARIRSFMTDDWVCVATQGGITSVDDFLRQIQSGRLQHTEMSTEQSRVKVYGTTGIVTGKGYSKGTFDGKEFSFHEWSTSVFIPHGSHWKCVLTMLTNC